MAQGMQLSMPEKTRHRNNAPFYCASFWDAGAHLLHFCQKLSLRAVLLLGVLLVQVIRSVAAIVIDRVSWQGEEEVDGERHGSFSGATCSLHEIRNGT